MLRPERRAVILAHTPMWRFGEERELIGDRAGLFITGEELVVNGGFASQTV